MSYRCDICERLWDDGAAADNEFLCTRKCNGKLVRVTSEKNAVGNLDTLPSILALPLHEYETEIHPVLKLWHACDAVELTLRFVVMTGLADLARHGPMPDALLRELRDRIEKPSLGKWQGMAEAVVRFLPQGETVLTGLRPMMEAHIVPLLEGNAKPRAAFTSLLALRGQLAHGGGITRAVAARLVEAWQPRIEAFADALAWTADILLAVRTPDGKIGLLRGPQPQPEPWQPSEAIAVNVAAAFARGDEVLLIRGDNVLTLWPLTLFGPPRNADPDAEPSSEVLFQVYVRRGDVQLQFTPLGSDVCPSSEGDISAHDAFRALFRLDEAMAEAREKGFEVRGFEKELHKDADDLVGRARDLNAIRQKLAEHREGGVLWLSGPAGIGKSYLVASIATEVLDKPPEGTVVLTYRFKAGDDRCSRESFLRFAIERIRVAIPEAPEQDDKEGKDKGEDRKQDTSARALLEGLKKRLGALAGKKVLFILDGLDEIAERDARFAVEVPLALTLPGITWFCAGRPERGLPEAFSIEKCAHIFPDGVPPMDTEDVRTMLLEQIGPLRKRLLANDREQGDQVNNAFVSKVADCAKGLPLYVRYVVNDIKGLKLRVLDVGERLPPSLDRYHEELLQRCAVGILHQVVTPLVATLAVAQEPLADTALKEILARGNVLPDDEEALPLIRRALAAVASMIRCGTTPDGNDGYVLSHHSLRQHMESSANMAPAIKTARHNLSNLAKEPGDGLAAPYLYRRGVSHLLETNRLDEALTVLTNFDYLMARLQKLHDPEGIRGLLTDWHTVAIGQLNADQRLWAAFFRERANILRRGANRWPAYKILLQLAMEHADDSPITKQAEAWLEQGHCDWAWLRNVRRVPQVALDPCRLVLEGHTDLVLGALMLPNGEVLSWSDDHTLRIWDTTTGACRAVLEGHTDRVDGALLLPDGGVLSWAFDGTLRVWDVATGTCRVVLEGHTCSANPLLLPDGNVLSWGDWLDNTLRVWDVATGACRKVLEGHTDLVLGALMLPNGEVLSWSDNHTLRIWDTTTGACRAVLEGHTDLVDGALVLPDGNVLSWGGWHDHTLRIWDTTTGACRAVLEGHTGWVGGALVLPDGNVLSWGGGLDNTLRVWDVATGACRKVLDGHTAAVVGALVLPDGSVLSWSLDHTFRVWDVATGACRVVWEGPGLVEGTLILPDDGVLSWSDDNTFRVWDATTGACNAVLHGHPGLGPMGALVLPDGNVLSWRDNTLRVWDVATKVSRKELEGHSVSALGASGALVLLDGSVLSWADGTFLIWDAATGACRAVMKDEHTDSLFGHNGALLLPDGGVLVWAFDFTLRVWDVATGTCRVVLEGHTCSANPLLLPDGNVLSWGDWLDNTLRVWDVATGTCRVVLEGHTNSINGALLLPDGDILSWANDNTLRVWDIATGTCRVVLEGHTNSINGALVLPDGNVLSWGGWHDKTLRVWDATTGACSKVFKGHTGRVDGALVLLDGSVLSWAADHTFRVWDATTGACRAVINEDEAPFQRPDLIAARFSYRSDSSLSTPPEWTVGETRNAVVLAHTTSPLRVAWQAVCSGQGKTVFSDGTVVTTLADGHVFFLKLYHGAHRVTLAEALPAPTSATEA